jgi:hypothetical protein
MLRFEKFEIKTSENAVLANSFEIAKPVAVRRDPNRSHAGLL